MSSFMRNVRAAEAHQSPPPADSRWIHGASVAFSTFHIAAFLKKINKAGIGKADRIPHQCSHVLLQPWATSWIFYLHRAILW